MDPHGVLIGRDPKGDGVLESSRVSRQHARLFRDPFGRWIVEDLDSQRGVVIGEERVQACAVLPGQRITIGPYTLKILEPLERHPAADGSASRVNVSVGEAGDIQAVDEESDEPKPLSRVWLAELTRIVDRMEELTAPRELYPEVCRCLATGPSTAALVVRLSRSQQQVPSTPEVVACHLGGKAGSSSEPRVPNLHLSRRVLEAVRSKNQPVMAKSVHTADSFSTLTVEDEQTPRAVFCAPVSDGQNLVDVLYLDTPFDDGAVEVFDFVQAVARQVRLARRSLLLLDLKAEKRVLDHQLAMARSIQSRLTPARMPDVPGVDGAFHYEPAMWVGGDYCDVWLLPDGRLAFAVGDVSGKGLPAAMVMANLQAALRTATSFCDQPAEAVEHLNRHLCRHLPEDMFVTFFLGLFEPASGRLEYVNAGHLPPLLLQAGAPPVELPLPGNPVLGVLADPFTSEVQIIAPNAGLLVVTDGITEARSPAGEELGAEGLAKALRKLRVRSAKQIVAAAQKAAADTRGFLPQQDDITIFALFRHGVEDVSTA